MPPTASTTSENRRHLGPHPAAGVATDLDVFELAVLGMVVCDKTGRFQRVNSAFGDLVGRSSQELVGATFSSLTSPDDVSASIAVMRDLLSQTVETASFDKHYIRPDGTSVFVELNIRALTDAAGEVTGFLTQAVDITERERAAAASNAERHRLEEAEHIAGMSSFELDPATGTVHASNEAMRILGLPLAFNFADFVARIHPDDRATMVAAFGTCVDQHVPVDHIQRHLRPDGTIRWVQIRAAWIGGDDGRAKVDGTTLDITDLKSAEDALQFQAFHDTLTGLANRALFLDRLDHAMHKAERDADLPAVLFLDIDDFKDVNDSLGHPVGDELLVAVAQRLASVTRAGDTLARLGGDEFALLLESGVMPQTAEKLAGRIADRLASPFHVADAKLTVGVSIGIAISRDAHDSPQDLLRDADLAMYLAKQNGKGRFEIARPGMQDAALKHLALITDLRHAVENDELEVYFQTIVHVHDTTPAGAEALVRWHHPERGLVQPNDFIGIAESTGLIVPLGKWVLRTACRQAQAWRSSGAVEDDFYISVNLSPRELAEPTLVDDVARALRDSGLPPNALVLEITESSLMQDYDAGRKRLRALKSLGLRIALDDYGTGYSSLNRLGSLPVDIVKIDKCFIDRLTHSPKGKALVQSVIDVTKSLGMTSVAEGVERPDQQAALEELDCNFIQGYLFAKPVPAKEAATILRRLSGQAC